MPDTESDETDHCDAEGEEFDAPYRIGIMKRDVHYARDIAGQQGDGNGYIEQYVHERCGQIDRERTDQQINGKSDEEVGNFISVRTGIHIITSFVLNYVVSLSIRSERFIITYIFAI